MPPASWTPDAATVARSNLRTLMDELGLTEYSQLHRWSIENREEFWEWGVAQLGIEFATQPTATREGSAENSRWLPGARFNIVASALDGPADSVAVLHGRAGEIKQVTYGELRGDVARCGNGLLASGLTPGQAVAIVMPMTYEAVVGYLAVMAVGGVVVSIADSFAADEIRTRLAIAGARWAITQHVASRSGKELPMYEKVVAAGVERAVVVPGASGPPLRPEDIWWSDLLSDDTDMSMHVGDGDTPINILFSSGTTGDPKAIPWTHATPIKSAIDGYFHLDIHAADIVAWPTNLGWMMGPWLIFASLLNNASFALYDDVPTGSGFVEFVRAAGVTVLGVVPSLVAAWKRAGLIVGGDWGRVRVFSSTGETSRPDDMADLMAAAQAPVIEYCGGTEIGGGYITGTVMDPAIPGTFTTPALGLDIVIVDEAGEPADEGEVFLVPPSMGLSTTLLNRNHDEVYYQGLPDLGIPLRRHGDHMERLANGYWRALGRVDDTMNLGGIKVSSAEIERVVGKVAGVREVAAVATPPAGGGPEQLVVYVVSDGEQAIDRDQLTAAMQRELRTHLNPLFKVHDVVAIDTLPRTASAKIMRRTLRARYEGTS